MVRAKSRILAVMLALCLLITAPVTAFAATVGAVQAAASNGQTAIAVENAMAEGSEYITDENQAAKILADLDILSGVGTKEDGTPDLALDLPVTRVQATTILVKLLTATETAEYYAEEYNRSGYHLHRFEDVPTWAEGYVTYAYQNRLSAGISDKVFGSDNVITTTEYLSLLLKALGYETGTDFAWNEAATLSDALGFTRGEHTVFEQIDRGALAVITSNALNCMARDRSGTLYEHLTAHVDWSVDEDGTLHITGKGPMPSGSKADPWYAADGGTDVQITSVDIGSGITSINDHAFTMSSITSATIPDTVVSIGDEAFKYCENLVSITIPDCVTSLGSSVFEASGLTSVTVGSGVPEISHYAFAGCFELREVNLSEGLTAIRNSAFYSCDALTSITIPDSVTTVETAAFLYCTNLEKVSFGSKLSSMPGNAFIGCPKLVSIEISEDNPNYKADGLMVFSKDGKTLASYRNAAGNITVPEGITTIGECAFANCDDLTSVTLPASVKTIEQYAFSNSYTLEKVTIGKNVSAIAGNSFEGSTELKTLDLSAENPYFKMDGDMLLSADGKTFVCMLNASDKVIIPDGVEVIGADAFQYSDVSGVEIPDTVSVIGDRAFNYCYAMSSIVVPSSVTSIGADAFADCLRLKDIYFEGSEEAWTALNVQLQDGITIHYDYTGE